jgi:hypothetical protein
MGVPPIYRPFIDGFSLFNHPAIGVAHDDLETSQELKGKRQRFGAEKSTPCICRSLRTTCIDSIRHGCSNHFSCRSLTACRVFCLC